MDEQAKKKRPTCSDEFKEYAVRLVVVEGYSFKKACQTVDVCEAALRS
ncbi:transposase [Bremerella cremea]|uniref:Transposase n=1 Tax=Bremerella cremea TaxID=1031537 RepID=A0A368KN34_9BACT|nr:transposase [Bremerella cremea]